MQLPLEWTDKNEITHELDLKTMTETQQITPIPDLLLAHKYYFTLLNTPHEQKDLRTTTFTYGIYSFSELCWISTIRTIPFTDTDLLSLYYELYQ